MPAPGAEAEGAQIYGYLGVIATALGAVAVNFLRGWVKGQAEEPPTVAKPVILERADLADMSDTKRLMADLKPRLEQVYEVEQGNRMLLLGNQERMDRLLRGMERWETELEVAKRLREEAIVAAAKRRQDEA